MDAPVRIYTPEPRSLHPLEVVREIGQGFRRSRAIAVRLVTRDIRTEHSVTALGFVWDILDPLVFAGVFWMLYRSRVVPSAELPMHYSTYVVVGMLLYQSFVDSTMLSMNSMKRTRSLITQVRVPPETLPLAAFLRACFNSSFRVAVMVGFALVAREISVVGSVQALLLMPVMLIAGVSIGTLFAPFNSIYSDFGRFVGVLFIGLRFVTPTVFFYPAGSYMNSVNYLNPVALFVRNLRSLMVQGEWYAPEVLAVHVGVLAIVGAVGLFVFHISLPVVAERL